MLKKLTLHNFQKWKKLEVELDERATFLVGKSDAGKSAVLRALKWLCTNRPGGEAFVRSGASGARVTLRLVASGHGVPKSLDAGRDEQGDDEVVRAGDSPALRRVDRGPLRSQGNSLRIDRSRGKSGNSYSLDGERYTAFGAGVPDAIAGLLNVGPENFQGQHDPPFWFGLSPGEVSKELNRIVALDLIDASLTHIAGEVRRAKAAAEVSQERLTAAEERRQGLRWVRSAARDLGKLEKLDRTLSETRLKSTLLRSTLERMGEAHETIRSLSEARIASANACSAGGKLEASTRKALALRNHLDQIGTAREEQCQLTERLQNVVTRIASQRTCPTCGGPLRP